MNRGVNPNNMNFPNMPNIPSDTEDFMYPEIYQTFAPIVEQLIRDMERQYGDIYLTEDLLNQMVDEAIHRAGIENMPSAPVSTDQDGEAIQTINEFGRHGGRDRGRDRDRWRRYDRSALSDIYRILILQQVFGRRRPRWKWR
jgi:hypothetical protein